MKHDLEQVELQEGSISGEHVFDVASSAKATIVTVEQILLAQPLNPLRRLELVVMPRSAE
jgi:hypothetical protein